MGPLFKAIKKGEATTERPFRHLSGEVRALARTQVWLRTWFWLLEATRCPAAVDCRGTSTRQAQRARGPTGVWTPAHHGLRAAAPVWQGSGHGPGTGWLEKRHPQEAHRAYAGGSLPVFLSPGARHQSASAVPPHSGLYASQVHQGGKTHLLDSRSVERLLPCAVVAPAKLDLQVPAHCAMGRCSPWAHVVGRRNPPPTLGRGVPHPIQALLSWAARKRQRLGTNACATLRCPHRLPK